jgi:hypothetical protein
MTNPALGFKSYLQAGAESTYGTPVAATAKSEVMPGDMCDLVPGIIDDASLNSQRARRGFYDGVQYYKGSTKMRANYEGKVLLMMLRSLFGNYATGVGTPVNDAGVVNHIFTEGGNSYPLTLQRNVGDVASTTGVYGKVFRPAGVKVNQGTFEMQAGSGGKGMGIWSFDYIAQDQTSDQTPTGALSLPLLNPVLYRQTLSFSDGTGDATADVKIRSIKFGFNAPLTNADRAFLASTNLIDEPLPNDFVVATCEIQQEFKTKSQFNIARNRTAVAPNVIFQGGFCSGSVNDKFELEIRMQQAKFIGYTNPVEGYGVLTSTAQFQAYNDPVTNSDLSSLYIRIQNNDTALP